MADASDAVAAEPERGPMTRSKLVAQLVVAVLVVVAGSALVQAPVGSCNVHVASQLAGSPEAFAEHLDGCGDVGWSDVRASLLLDLGYAAAYGAVLHVTLRRTWRGWRLSRLRSLQRAMPLLPIVAAAFDVAEGIATFAVLDVPSTGALALRSDTGALAISVLAWPKWLLLAVTAVAIATSAVGSLANLGRHRDPVRDVVARARGEAELAVCCSGGGIRSAAYSLGVLRALDDAGELEQARWLAAVSGGAYTAGAYVGGRMSGPGDDPSSFTPVGLADIEDHLRDGHHRFLSSCPGGLVRSALWVVGLVLGNVVLIAAAVYAVAWPVGRLLGSWVFEGTVTDVGASTTWADVQPVATSHWLPGAVFLAVAVVVLLASALSARRWREVVAAASATAGLGAGLVVALVVAPVTVEVVWWLLVGSVETPVVFGVSTAAVFAVVWRFLQQPLVKLAPRLGGVALAVVCVAFGAYVAVAAIEQRNVLGDGWTWVAVAAAVAAFYLTVDIGWMSVRLMYRSRLRTAFSLKHGASGVVPRGRDEQPGFDDPAPPGPELLICAAAHRIGRGRNGIPAESFTVSPTAVAIGEVSVSAADWFAALPARMAQDRTISSWQATTGAAFSSAMGRFHYGTTNALLAALNIDLGGWFPNPARVKAGFRTFPKVRAGYLVKEILGLYDLRDDYVFVADGGQWENLGLVELLRRRCEVIVCVDASGDAAGAYTTLREAVALATTELDVWVDLSFLTDLDDPNVGLPRTTVGVGTIHYRRGAESGEDTGLLLFAKAQVAQDLPLALRQFAMVDGTFPRYSTADQLLEDDQFGALVDLGKASGASVLETIAGIRTMRAHLDTGAAAP